MSAASFYRFALRCWMRSRRVSHYSGGTFWMRDEWAQSRGRLYARMENARLAGSGFRQISCGHYTGFKNPPIWAVMIAERFGAPKEDASEWERVV